MCSNICLIPVQGKSKDMASKNQIIGYANTRNSSAPKLMKRLRLALRSRHYSRRTEQVYCLWVKHFICFHKIRHPAEMAEPEINAFLTHLAVTDKVSASTQNQALSALLFLYRHVLGHEVGDLGKVIRARKPKRLPEVMTRVESWACRCSKPDGPSLKCSGVFYIDPYKTR